MDSKHLEPIELFVDVLGVKYLIIEDDIENDGECDSSTRIIKIDKSLNRVPNKDDKKDLKQYKRKVLRHEVIHAIMEECGLSVHADIHNEQFVDWIAVMYPKLKVMFEKLEIEK